jgi:hypothetical protein
MIDVDMARLLRGAGLAWQPSERDCFAIPESQMDGQVFVVSHVPAQVEVLNGRPALTFHGSSEWALDYLFTTDAVWLPSETQLREAIERLTGDDLRITLERTQGRYRCQVTSGGQGLTAEGDRAEAAYGGVLLALLQSRA